MKSNAFVLAAVALVGSGSSALAEPPAVQGLPPLVADAAVPPVPSHLAAPGEGVSSPQQLYAHVLRGVVAIERNGSPMAIGTVLGGDGRILTSLSGLGSATGADVRYSDGTTVHAKVGHTDKVTDLALLVPESTKWLEGLAASEAEPVGAALRVILPARGAHLGPADASVKRRVDAHAHDGEPLRQMLEVDVRGSLVAGAPLLDSAGSVMGILVRACKGLSVPDGAPWAAWGQAGSPSPKPPSSCAPVVLGAPVSFLRAFLSDVAAPMAAPSPWLGIRGEPQVTGAAHGVRVVAIASSSPAAKAGLRAGADVVVAVDGQSVDTPDKLAAVIAKHSPGDSVKLLLLGGEKSGEKGAEKFREVTVLLQAVPVVP